MERHPIRFMDAELEGHLDRARAALADFVHVDADDLAFVANATTGVNTVLRSLDFNSGDEILTTDHEYNACINAIRYVAARAHANVVVASIPLPIAQSSDVTEAILERVTERTRLAVISHVTSPTGLVFPIERIVARLAERGVDTLVDGAHAPGMVDLDVSALGAAYYTGNGHKWLCSPKGSAFLHVRRDRQQGIVPLVVSHGANSPRHDRSRYRLESDWGGTADPSTYLAVPAALDFMSGLLPGGWSELRARNRDLARAARSRLLAVLGSPTPLAPDDMLGSLAAVELPPSTQPPIAQHTPNADDDATYPLDPLHDMLYEEDRIEVPVLSWPHAPAYEAARRRLLRVSAQLYNDAADYDRLASAIASRI